MAKIFIGEREVNRALSTVQRELELAGLWSKELADIDVVVEPCGTAHGWITSGRRQQITIPAISLVRTVESIFGRPTSLADVLRHEYAHALAEIHLGLIRSSAFREAFGGRYRDAIEYEYDPELFVTEYAATSACESFAETFMLFLKHQGRLPTRLQTPAIRVQWQFVARLCKAIGRARRRWVGRPS